MLHQQVQKLAPNEVKKWHRTIIKSLQENGFQNVEEICTGALFSMLAEKHLLINADTIDIIPAIIEQLMSLLLGAQTVTAKNVSEFLVRDERATGTLSPHFSSIDGDSLPRRLPSEYGDRTISFNKSMSARPVTSSPLSPFQHDLNSERRNSSASSTIPRRYSSSHEGSGNKGHAETLGRNHRQTGYIVKKVANCVVLQFNGHEEFRDVMQVLADGYVKENDVVYPLPKFFLLVLVMPKSCSTMNIPKYLNTRLFYRVVLEESPIVGHLFKRQALITFNELELLSQHLTEVYCSPEVWRYAKKVILALRQNPKLYFGVPAMVSNDLLVACRIAAIMLFGSSFVTVEHVHLIAKHSVSHKLQLKVSYKDRNIDGTAEYQMACECLEEVFVNMKKNL